MAKNNGERKKFILAHLVQGKTGGPVLIAGSEYGVGEWGIDWPKMRLGQIKKIKIEILEGN